MLPCAMFAKIKTPKAGASPQDMPIHLSNLAVIDPDEGGPTRVGFKMDGETKKRFAKKSGAWIDG